MERQEAAEEKGKKSFWVSDMEAVLAIFIVLLVFGSINVFSSSFILAETTFGTPYFFLQRQLFNLAAGFFCFFLGCRVNYHRWRAWIVPVVIITILSLIAVLLVGAEVNGSKRWLGTAGFQIQPAEIAKLVSLMLISAYAAYRVRNDKPIDILFPNPQYLLVLFMGLLIELEPDGGTMFIVISVPFVLLCIAGLQKTKVLTTVAVFAAAGTALSILQPYRLARLKVLLDPWADSQGIGYQTVQSLSAIGSGGLTGMGLGMGTMLGTGFGAGMGTIARDTLQSGNMMEPTVKKEEGVVCKACNNVNKAGAKFCLNCGEKLGGSKRVYLDCGVALDE